MVSVHCCGVLQVANVHLGAVFRLSLILVCFSKRVTDLARWLSIKSAFIISCEFSGGNSLMLHLSSKLLVFRVS